MVVTRRDWIVLLISLALPFVAGLIGSSVTTPAIPDWYAGLAKPSFSPPNWIFGPVWTTLYILMGIALFRVWRRAQDDMRARYAAWLFIAHFALNTLWSILFFGLQNPLYGLIDIVVLWVALVISVGWFWKIDRVAGWLLVPYLLWVSFATVLNAAIWYLN